MTFIGASLRPPPPHCSLPSPEELPVDAAAAPLVSPAFVLLLDQVTLVVFRSSAQGMLACHSCLSAYSHQVVVVQMALEAYWAAQPSNLQWLLHLDAVATAVALLLRDAPALDTAGQNAPDRLRASRRRLAHSPLGQRPTPPHP